MSMERYFIEVNYDDETGFNFHVDIEGDLSQHRATLMMITRGTLMASSARSAYCYDMQGFDVCAYVR